MFNPVKSLPGSFHPDPLMPKPKATVPAVASFSELKLAKPLLTALEEVGYESPSPIQAEAIPHLLEGLDLLGHAPTGTGKTAAFALPLLSRIDLLNQDVQVMTLTPTRELAIQVAEAFQRYASHIKGFHVLPIYGGQDYTVQIRALKRGVHVVVGTPGRVMDHMRKGTLKLGGLQALVLDEADEMLRMGFIDEVEWILEKTPAKRQMALFSATMPKQIERIARKYLNNPQEISIKSKTATAETIRQRYWLVSGFHKLDAFTRILEVEDFDAMLVFVRTKIGTTELAERLAARGYVAAAMNGDMAQKDREKMVERLKKGSLDILVATDVAARGLDVDRISHVINYDIPYDAEAYIHRIGRTGRAGRTGDAILFVAPRERRMLNVIERATRQKITPLELPTTETVNNKRIADFKQKITDTLAAGELAFMQGLVEQYQQEHDVPATEIAAALAKLFIGDKPLLMKPDKDRPKAKSKSERSADSHQRDEARPRRRDRKDAKGRKDRPDRGDTQRDRHGDKDAARHSRHSSPPDADMERFRIEVGYDHDAKPGNIVGAIANEAGLDGEHIGQIEINEQFSMVDLPKGMPKEVFNDLKKVWVCGQQLKISRLDEGPSRRNMSKQSDKKPGEKKRSGAKPGAKKKIDFKAKNDKSGAKHKPGAKKKAGAKADEAKPGGSNSAAGAKKKKSKQKRDKNKGKPAPGKRAGGKEK
jgi:ATP-dependent RNA helicase DeaD